MEVEFNWQIIIIITFHTAMVIMLFLTEHIVIHITDMVSCVTK